MCSVSANTKTKCAHCGKAARNLCGKCRSVSYCGRACQVSDWRAGHKSACAQTAEEAVSKADRSAPPDSKAAALSPEDVQSGIAKQNSVHGSLLDLTNAMIKNAALSSKDNNLQALMNVYESPDLAQEFRIRLESKKCYYPDMEPKVSTEILKQTSAEYSALWMTEMMHSESGKAYLDISDPTELAQRLGASSLIDLERKVDWYFKAAWKDVYEPTEIDGYQSTVYNSFSNAFVHPEIVELGRVCVAVGFVDFSQLMAMTFTPGSKDGPLRYIAFEKCPFNVAKGLVISEMLKLESGDESLVNAILQVHVSSCWSYQTVGFFRLGIQSLKSCFAQYGPEVEQIISGWLDVVSNSSSLPLLKTARTKWLEKIDTSIFSPCLNALDREARGHLVDYFLTGQLLDANVGSVCMFASPSEYLVSRSRNESCFHVFSDHDLVSECQHHNGDFVNAAVQILRRRIIHLKSHVLSGKIKIEVQPPVTVSMANPAIVEQIRSLDPYYIIWNNVLDYVTRY
ncbi:MAG: hypothetical protein SGCHY_003714 [Lobulomycetales sp.]